MSAVIPWGNKCGARWVGGSCERAIFAVGLCQGHVTQQRRGQLFTRLRNYRPLNLTDYDLATWCVQKATHQQGSCRIWNYALSSSYPCITQRGKQIRVHRLVAAQLVIKRALTTIDVVHHKCAVRACINPDDLQVTTAQANTAEMRDRNYLLARIKELEIENTRLLAIVAELSEVPCLV